MKLSNKNITIMPIENIELPKVDIDTMEFIEGLLVLVKDKEPVLYVPLDKINYVLVEDKQEVRK